MIWFTKKIECNFEYNLVRKKVKYLRLKIDKEGKIQVSAPLKMNLNDINRFINSKQYWINDKLKLIKKEGKYILLFGEKYNFRISNLDYVDYEKKMIYTKYDLKVEANIKRIYKKLATNYLKERLKFISKKIGLDYNKLSFRFQTTRWGSCNRYKDISLNCYLIKFNKIVIDYVLIHELCHTIHMNHSKDFWNLVKKHCPDYEQLKKTLKSI